MSSQEVEEKFRSLASGDLIQKKSNDNDATPKVGSALSFMNNKNVIIGMVVLGVVIAGIIAYFAIKKKGKDTPATASALSKPSSMKV